MENKMKLTMEIRNQRPIELIDLAHSMLSVGSEYQAYLGKYALNIDADGAKLHVREVRTGSIITELVALAPYALPLVEHADSILEYGKYLLKGYDWLIGRGKGATLEKMDKNTLQNFSSIIEPVAKDRGSQLILSGVTINGDVNFSFNIGSTEANAAQNAIRRELEMVKESITGIHSQVLMYWAQARNQLSGKGGDRACIESLYRGDVKVLFANDGLKTKMLFEPDHPFEKAFIVDVAVETVNDKPMLYRVLDLHETIDRE
jgi:hypothetical protein